MMLKDRLREIVLLQKQELKNIDKGIKRDLKIDPKLPYAIIISGIRRCGKSTLLNQSIKKNSPYFNFEDPRALNFELSDFEKLNEIFSELYGDQEKIFFDEIQNVTGWERFIRRMVDSGKGFFITGSNASMLSRELGTKLTGRHLNNELFPFSFNEFLIFNRKKASYESFKEYFLLGGFPNYLKYKDVQILHEVFKDIIFRDIIVRYGLKNEKLVQDLAIYLMTNVGKEFSLNKLAATFNVPSANSVSNYVSYYEDSYLLFTIPKFDYSLKKMIVNPKKVYSIDVGMSRANSSSFSKDSGRVLENLVFLHLRRRYKDIYYFKEKGECDFIIKENENITQAIQVCYDLNDDNLQREINGLKEAMNKFNIKKGFIVTMSQSDNIDDIQVIPAFKWMS